MLGLVCKINRYFLMFGLKIFEIDLEKVIVLMGDYNMFGYFIFYYV